MDRAIGFVSAFFSIQLSRFREHAMPHRT